MAVKSCFYTQSIIQQLNGKHQGKWKREWQLPGKSCRKGKAQYNWSPN